MVCGMYKPTHSWTHLVWVWEVQPRPLRVGPLREPHYGPWFILRKKLKTLSRSFLMSLYINLWYYNFRYEEKRKEVSRQWSMKAWGKNILNYFHCDFIPFLTLKITNCHPQQIQLRCVQLFDYIRKKIHWDTNFWWHIHVRRQINVNGINRQQRTAILTTMTIFCAIYVQKRNHPKYPSTWMGQLVFRESGCAHSLPAEKVRVATVYPQEPTHAAKTLWTCQIVPHNKAICSVCFAWFKQRCRK